MNGPSETQDGEEAAACTYVKGAALAVQGTHTESVATARI
jgi:calcineurin-like phosphoesterase